MCTVIQFPGLVLKYIQHKPSGHMSFALMKHYFISLQMIMGKRPTIPTIATASLTKSSQGGCSLTSPVKCASKCGPRGLLSPAGQPKAIRGLTTHYIAQTDLLGSGVPLSSVPITAERTLLPPSFKIFRKGCKANLWLHLLEKDGNH